MKYSSIGNKRGYTSHTGDKYVNFPSALNFTRCLVIYEDMIKDAMTEPILFCGLRVSRIRVTPIPLGVICVLSPKEQCSSLMILMSRLCQTPSHIEEREYNSPKHSDIKYLLIIDKSIFITIKFNHRYIAGYQEMLLRSSPSRCSLYLSVLFSVDIRDVLHKHTYPLGMSPKAG